MKSKKFVMTKGNIFMWGVVIGILLYWSFSLISASSVIGNIPDVCLPYNVSYYDIWLEDYYNIDIDADVKIKYTDPLNNRTVLLPPNYATLNLACYEMGYYFNSRTGFSPLTDVIRFQTYDDNCDASFRVTFIGEDGLNQYFNLRVSDNCSGSGYLDDYVSPPSSYYNFSSSVLNSVVSFFRFDNDYLDYFNNLSLSSIGLYSPTYSFDSVHGYSLNVTEDVVFNISDYSVFSDKVFGYSFWFNTSGSNSTIVDYIRCDNGLIFELLLGQICFSIDGSTCINPTYTSYHDSNFHHVVLSSNSSNIYAYVDGSVIWSASSTYDISSCEFFSGIFEVGNTRDSVDDFIIFDKFLNSSDVSFLYNSGSGLTIDQISAPNLPLTNGSISDVYLSGDDSYSIDLDNYFDYWEDIYVIAPDPINDYQYKLYTGYSTLNADFYEFTLYSNGTLYIESYLRPYSFSFDVYACNYTPFEECSNLSFNVYINTGLADVVQLNPLQAYYDLGFVGHTTFSGNYFYQYYEDIVFSFPDSNFTGVLNSTFPYSYVEIDNPINNASYMVFLNCSINSSSYVYNYLGDLNVSMECGDYQSYFLITAYNNYNQKVYLTAYNGNSSISDYTYILSGNSDLPSGYIPNSINFTSTPRSFTDNFLVFSSVFPDGISQSSKNIIVFCTLSIIVFLIYFIFRSSLISFFYVSSVLVLMLLFLFASMNYITLFSPILFTFLFLLYSIIKFLKGGF